MDYAVARNSLTLVNDYFKHQRFHTLKQKRYNNRMKKERRDFLKKIAASGMGLGLAPHLHGKGIPLNTNGYATGSNKNAKGAPTNQTFNMCGYRAPKIETVRVGFIGVGSRGYANLRQMTYLEGVEIKAICDIVQPRIDEAQQLLAQCNLPRAKAHIGDEEWKRVCEAPDIDLISIAVPRGPLHAAISVYAMECGKHVAVEVPAIATVDEAWEVVEVSERTRKHCFMMENCCYDFFELLTLNMARQGFFGDIIHADAAYIHYQKIYEKPKDKNMWRLKESQRFGGNIYPTHGLGPVCQAMDINRGDKLNLLVSMTSDDFTLGKKVAELAETDPFYRPFNTNSYKGNMNTSIIRTEKGKTIMLQHDTSSPRVYTRIHMLSGTKGAAQKYPEPARISIGHQWLNEEEMEAVYQEYTPEIVKRVGEKAKEVGGHGGMDFLMTWRLIDCLRNGLPLDIDVYDAAAWSVIIPLSQWSEANNSKPIEIPDFTRGA